MPNPKPDRRQTAYHLDSLTRNVIRSEAQDRGISMSDAVNTIVEEWLELRNREASEPTLVAVHDSSVSKRINELQRTVEGLAQKVQNLTLKERLGRHSRR